jgi:hypothetical protein
MTKKVTAAEPEQFESWAIVEIFGHQTFVGLVTEQAIGGCNFVRVDVPDLPAVNGYPKSPAFTKLFGQGAIYAITPMSKEAAMVAATRLRPRPVTEYLLPAPASRQIEDGDDENG